MSATQQDNAPAPVTSQSTTEDTGAKQLDLADPNWRRAVAEIASGTRDAVLSSVTSAPESKDGGALAIRPMDERGDGGTPDGGTRGGTKTVTTTTTAGWKVNVGVVEVTGSTTVTTVESVPSGGGGGGGVNAGGADIPLKQD